MRNTDADWTKIAEMEPYFGVLGMPEFLSEALDEPALERFYESGRRDIAHVVTTLRQHFDDRFAPELAIDFGCGVGRLTLAMRDHATRVIGVDVAPRMRALADEAAKHRGITDVSFTDEIPDVAVDWVNSLIVFQHIPPQRGYAILGDLAARIRVGGLLSVQITTHRDPAPLHEIFRDVESARFDGSTMTVFSMKKAGDIGSMSMYDYDLGRVAAMLSSLGFRQLLLQHTNHGGVEGYWIFARRD